VDIQAIPGSGLGYASKINSTASGVPVGGRYKNKTDQPYCPPCPYVPPKIQSIHIHIRRNKPEKRNKLPVYFLTSALTTRTVNDNGVDGK